MDKRLVMLALLCGGGIAIMLGWHAGDRDRDSPATARAPSDLDEESTAVHAGSLVEPERPLELERREAVESEPAASPDSPDARTAAPEATEEWLYYGPETRVPIPDSYFDELYPSDLPLDELEQKLELAADRMRDKGTELFDLRYEAGLYELRKQVPFEEWREHPVAVSKGNGPALQIRTNFNGDHENAHIVWLPFDECPEYYELKDEWAYLGYRVAEGKKLEQSSAAAQGSW